MFLSFSYYISNFEPIEGTKYMYRIPSHSFRKKLCIYGIIPTLCLNFLYLNAEEEKSLVILEGRRDSQIPSDANLHQKVQFFTALVNEQVTRIQSLRDEVQSLKNKLHFAQLAAFSEEKGNYRQIYSALKQEKLQNKETQNQLEKIIFQLKKENKEESLKNEDAKDHIISLITALESQAYALDTIREEYQQGLASLASSNNEANHFKQLYQSLEQETAQYNETQRQLEKLIEKLSFENDSEKQKISDAEAHIAALTIAMKEQTLSLEKIQENYKSQLENSSWNSEEANKYKILYASLEQDFNQNKETQKQLELLLQQMKNENEAEKQKISNAEAYVDSLLAALSEQTISMEAIQLNHKNQIEQLSHALNEAEHAKNIRTTLEQELAQTREAQIQLEQFIHQLKDENESAQQKISDAEVAINALMDALDMQSVAMESMQQDHKKKIEQIILMTETENYKHLNEILEAEYIYNLLTFEEEQQNFLNKYQELAFNYENAKKQTIQQAQSELIGVYSSLEDEKFLALITDHLHSHSLLTLEMHLKAAQEASDALRYLAEAIEIAYLQHQFLIKNAEIEQEDNLWKWLDDLNEERSKTIAIQKNFDQVQQIHDQTVKLYNELYTEHKSSQKQFEHLQKELDERKMNHLVERDDLERRIENLSDNFKKEQELHEAELGRQQLAVKDLEGVIQKLQQENKTQNAIIEEKKEEISNLSEEMNLKEEEIKKKFQQLLADLEIEKNKNNELHKEVADQGNLMTFHQNNILERQQELEKLKNELTLNNENFLMQKIEKEDLCERLKCMNEEKSKLILQLQMFDEKQNADTALNKNHELEMNDVLEQLMNVKSENQSLIEEITNLKKQHSQSQEKLSGNDEIKAMALQLERLQQALQQVINEKTALQSEYQNQLINEKMLSERLEKSLTELKGYKDQ